MGDLQRRAVEEFVPRWLALHNLLKASGEEDFRRRARAVATSETNFWEPLAYVGLVDRSAFMKAADSFATDAGAWAAAAVEEYRRTGDPALRAAYDVTFERVGFLHSIGIKGSATRTYGTGTLADDAKVSGLVLLAIVIAILLFKD